MEGLTGMKNSEGMWWRGGVFPNLRYYLEVLLRDSSMKTFNLRF